MGYTTKITQQENDEASIWIQVLCHKGQSSFQYMWAWPESAPQTVKGIAWPLYQASHQVPRASHLPSPGQCEHYRRAETLRKKLEMWSRDLLLY